jgi:hemolysin III
MKQMIVQQKIRDPQTPQEERVNWLTHGLGLVLSLIGLGALLALTAPRGPASLFAGGVYGASLVLMFAVSTFYHACTHGPVKCAARMIDHCAILMLIAGSYTPFMLLGLGGWKGWTIMTVVWMLAVAGIHHKFTSSDPFGPGSVALCLVMGFLVMAVWPWLTSSIAPTAVAWLVAGGAAYVLGIPFYAWRDLPYNHGIWHIFSLAGAGCHYVAVLQVVA